MTLEIEKQRHHVTKIRTKTVTKLNAQNACHINTLRTAFEHVSNKHPDILNDPNRPWNVDETEISSTQGRVQKVFSSSVSHLSGSVIQNSTCKLKHVTVFVAISAGGLIAPQLIIGEGKI